MSTDLKNKIVVITGGAVGSIGFEIADKFLNKDAKVAVILDINETEGKDAAKTLISKHGAHKAVYIKCDVTKDLEEAFKKIIDTYKYIDVLVNSAGLVNENVPKICIDINVTALIEWSLKCWELMRKDKSGKGGTIINLGSIYGFTSDQFLPVYQASKFAVMGFTRSLGHKYNYDRTGVKVLALCPGFTETKLTSSSTVRDDHQLTIDRNKFMKGGVAWQKTDVVGDAAVEVFGKDSGTAWVIDGGQPIKEV